MNARWVCLASAFVLLPFAHAADKKDGGRYLAQPLKGDYYTYGGSIGDSTPPTPKDRKLSLMFTGPLAKDMFDHIGPDVKKSCGTEPEYRERIRGDLHCTWAKAEGYSCYFGLDVRTGKSISDLNC